MATRRPEPLPKGTNDPLVLIRTSRLEWKRAVYLAQIIGNPTYRNEMMYKVAESMASGSASIANEYRQVSGARRPVAEPAPACSCPRAPAAPKPADRPARRRGRGPPALSDQAKARRYRRHSERRLTTSSSSRSTSPRKLTV